MRSTLIALIRRHIFIIAVLLSLVFSFSPLFERNEYTSKNVGQRLQSAIPTLGLICAFNLNDAPEYAGRFFAGLASVHLVRIALPEEGINLRPDGGSYGFPSGHAYSASFGASYMLRQCAMRLPYIGLAAALGAGFVGASRVEAEKHTSLQVVAGALFAVFFDIAFRKRLSFAALWVKLGRTLAPLWHFVMGFIAKAWSRSKSD